MFANGRAITQVNLCLSLVTPIRVVRMSKSLKPEAVQQRTGMNRTAHDGVEKDSAPGQFCQELGRPAAQHRRESDEAEVVKKRVTTVERRASA
jgi:hypothetical protein